jgi:hypothetical protein
MVTGYGKMIYSDGIVVMTTYRDHAFFNKKLADDLVVELQNQSGHLPP